jgi:hypothetical protein
MSIRRSKLRTAPVLIDQDRAVRTQPNKKNIRNAPHIQKIQQQRLQSISITMQDPASHSVSADRRHSIMKVNRTEAHFE